MEQHFSIRRVVCEDGILLNTDYESLITKELVEKFYYHLLRTRAFDKKAVSLQRQGRIGTYAPYEGQEASQVGSALALNDKDWLVPSYRDHGASITFGQSLLNSLLFWKGRNEGCIPPENRKIFPPCVPIATQIPHAVGLAYSEQLKGTDNAAIVYFGDGATSEGDFHEGLNYASVLNAPVILFCQNNYYAISVPYEKQTNTKTIAQKSLAYDIKGIRVDGNDVFSVYFETKKALEESRKGSGPVLIEAVTWRYGAHTTADDPSKYRDQKESEKKRKFDPILRLERFMKNYYTFSDDWMLQLEKEIDNEIEEAILALESFPKPNPNNVIDYVFNTPTWILERQREKYINARVGKNY
ncbi:pyruvate dehydrogenase (acetyl-transferring) E1 component subunit alpha [Solibacillus sp. CAU 1738]|uniref:pyruvate dehydrogenase (acetyl-transferring) E1 component subunit alpha n=1 Tax=Solibacillus sp. CAU 1738 TaxID=3140363 RepID=UPI0032616C06